MAFLPFLSAVFGWVYTFCWSASFYPQPLLNWRRSCTTGTTVDFPFINVLGFAAYLVSNLAFYYSPLIRAQYAARNTGLTPTVQFNDITFALHALIISCITLSQYMAAPLWSFTVTPGTQPGRPSRFILGVFIGCIVGVVLTYSVVVGSGDGATPGPRDPASDWCELDMIYAISYVKLLVTLIKFTPQIVINWRNQSTKGWSISQVLLDLVGGFLSVGQQGIDSYLQGNWSGITGNPVKFALGNVSIVYDVMFIIQHYVLYPSNKDDRGRRRSRDDERLLPNDEERERRLD